MTEDTNEIAGEIGETVRGAMRGWGPALRLCVVLAVLGALAAGWLLLRHALEPPERGPLICVADPPEHVRCSYESTA
jgi:hypothetical protein